MDNYGFHVAKVVGVAEQEDNRLQVKVLPQMEDITDGQCPQWSSFFRDELLMGKVGDYVWVICNDEFTTGYVFSLANYTTYQDVTKESGGSVFKKSTDNKNLSIPVTAYKKAFDRFDRYHSSNKISLSNAKVTFWSDTCVHFIEGSTGGTIQAYSSGTIYVFRPNEMFIRMGNSIFKIDDYGIHMKSSASNSRIEIEAPKVNLGKNPSAYVLINSTGNGQGAIASSYVKA